MDLDRKGVAAITVSVIILVAWWFYNNDLMKKQAAVRAEQEAKTAEVAKAKAAEEAETQKTAPADAAKTPATPPAAPEKLETLKTDSVDYTFTTHGGGIATALLKNHEAEPGTLMTLNEFGSIPIGAVSSVAGEQTDTPYTYAVDKDNSSVITFEGHDSSLLHLTKKFTVPHSTKLDKDYIVIMRLVFQNRSDKPMDVPAYFVHTGSAAPVHARDTANYTGFKWPGYKFVDVGWFQSGTFSKGHADYTASDKSIPWAAVADQYFTTLVAPIVPEVKADGGATPPPVAIRGVSVWAKPFPISDTDWGKTGHFTLGSSSTRNGIEGAIGMPGFKLAPNEMHEQSFRIYVGPREYGRLRLMPDGETDVLAFSDFGGLFSFLAPLVGLLSKVLLLSLNTIHSWLGMIHPAVGNYAIAIIVLTLILKGLLWGFQNKATQSAKRMQALAPKMTSIREKYQDDPARMNAEMMKLYKDYGVNPLSGCLPAMIQMPVFIGLYNMLGKAVELRNSKFLWVKDLSQPDTVFHIGSLPVNVLPLCMAGTMLWQMKASPKSGDPSQQRMMMFMPLVFILFTYNYASALALYLIVNNLVSVVQLYATRNQPPPTLQKRK